MSAEEREKGMEPNREQAELVASNILGLKEPYKYSDAGRQIMVLLDAKDRLLSEANANFSEARTTANLYYQNIQAKEEIIASLTAQLSEAQNCSVCGGHDLVCGKGWLQEKEKLQKSLEEAQRERELDAQEIKHLWSLLDTATQQSKKRIEIQHKLEALLESSKGREKGLREILKELLEDQDKEWKFERWPGLESSEWANPDAWKKHKEVCEKRNRLSPKERKAGSKCEHDWNDEMWGTATRNLLKKSDNPTCPFCPQPKDSEAVRTVDELNKIGQDFWKEYMSMISMEAHPTTAAGRLHELWFDVLRHERERKA